MSRLYILYILYILLFEQVMWLSRYLLIIFEQVVCSRLTDPSREGKYLLEELFAGLSVYFNYTGQSKCLDADQQADVRLDDRGWDFQVICWRSFILSWRIVKKNTTHFILYF